MATVYHLNSAVYEQFEAMVLFTYDIEAGIVIITMELCLAVVPAKEQLGVCTYMGGMNTYDAKPNPRVPCVICVRA